MGSHKVSAALERLGRDIRNARLRRNVAVVDFAVRAGTSPSSIIRLERGDRGVGIGTLADVLVALGLLDRLIDLVDVRKDDLGLALSSDRLPRRGKSLTEKLRKQKVRSDTSIVQDDVFDPDGASF